MNEQALVDSYGRRIRILRISLTDHCNFRCVYCMPPEGLPTLPHNQYLTTEQIARLVRIVGRSGVRRYRLTGGEPLLRKEVVGIVRALKDIDTVSELSMTTNGSLLPQLAVALKEAGLDRLNISLDSLDPQRFADITRSSQYQRVIGGVDAALRAGFTVKLNVVLLAGMPESEILEFTQLGIDHDIDVRFLEFMPLCGSGWEADRVRPIADVREIVRRHHILHELPRDDRPSQTFAIEGGRGRVGFIASLSEPFCDRCSRMRLTADGRIRPCLFSDYEVSIGGLLKRGESDEAIIRAIRHAVLNKPWGSEFADDPYREGEEKDREIATGSFIRSLGG
jgi:cyclic pyranopterin phosphate synthase